MRFFETKKAFTLMEVNLAIFIMAVGLLAMVALYPLAYRESRQSQDDVKAAAAADCVLNVLTGTLSSRNIKWEDWVNGIQRAINADGWLAYCDYGQGTYTPKKKGQIKSERDRVFNALCGINRDSSSSPTWPVNDELACALVVQWGMIPVEDNGKARWEEDYSRVAICLRVSRRPGELFGQPIFYTEIHFQGDQKDLVN